MFLFVWMAKYFLNTRPNKIDLERVPWELLELELGRTDRQRCEETVELRDNPPEWGAKLANAFQRLN